MDIEIIGKTPISIVEVKERLHEIEKKKELNFRALKVFEYVNDITTKKKK